jgi:hypothetical protein
MAVLLFHKDVSAQSSDIDLRMAPLQGSQVRWILIPLFRGSYVIELETGTLL